MLSTGGLLLFCPGSSFRSRFSPGAGTGTGPMISLGLSLITAHRSVSSHPSRRCRLPPSVRYGIPPRQGPSRIDQKRGILPMFYRVTGENQLRLHTAGGRPGAGSKSLPHGRRPRHRPCLSRRKKLLTCGGKLLVLRKPRLERGCPLQIVKGQVAAKIDDGAMVCSPTEGSARPTSLASPQSTTSVSPCLPRMMLAGLMSRWIAPREWA